jgi:dTMP kinase
LEILCESHDLCPILSLHACKLRVGITIKNLVVLRTSELDVEEVRNISLWAVDGLLPDLTILLDLPADVAMARRSGTGTEPDRLESERVEFFERARNEYLRLSKEPRFLVLDASESVQELHEKVLARVKLLES